MRLTTLRLTSFKSYENQILDLNVPRVLIAGENGTGKSTVREAVRWLLTGHCGVTDARGAGAELLAPSHTSLIQVSADSVPLGTISRRRNNGITEFSVGETKGEPSLQQQALYTKLNTTPEFVDAALETERFLRLAHYEAKDLVLALLDVKVQIGEELLTLDQVEYRYKQAFEDRKQAKIRVRQHAIPLPPDETFPPLEEIEALLTKLRTELEGHLQTVGALLGRREALQAQLDKATVSVPVEGDVEALRARLSEAQAAQTAQEPMPVAAGDFAAKARFLRSTEEALKAHDPKQGCVLDRNVECPQTKRKFTNRIKEIGIELSALPKTVSAPPRTDHTHDIRVLQERIRAIEVALETNALRQSEAEALRGQIASLDSPDASVVAAIDTLKNRIAKGELVRKHAAVYWEYVKTIEAAKVRKAELDADVERLEDLVELLGPKGAKVAALEAAIGKFQAAINPHLAGFGWEVSFQLDPWQVLVFGRPLSTYSESEQFRIGIAIQLAIAAMSGVSFAIIDRLDMLDAKNRALATKMILSAPLEQILILSTREPEAKLPTGSGFIAYRLAKQGGQTVIAEAVGA